MKKHLIFPTVALAVALVGCGQQGAEVTPTALPSAVPTEMITVAPVPTAATPTPAVITTPEPTPVPTVETDTPVSTPTAAPIPTPVSEPTFTPEPIPTLSPMPTPEPVPEVVDTPEPLPEPESVRPSDEEVLAAYHEAREAYTWFDLTTLPVISDNGVIGPGYYPVADERFPTMDALRSYLKGLFSDEVVDRLLPIDGEHYVEVDGVLSAIQMDRGGNENTGPVTETVVWPEGGTDTLCTVRVEAELLWEDPAYPEGKRVYDFPYQKVGDKWVFTQFESIF